MDGKRDDLNGLNLRKQSSYLGPNQAGRGGLSGSSRRRVFEAGFTPEEIAILAGLFLRGRRRKMIHDRDLFLAQIIKQRSP